MSLPSPPERTSSRGSSSSSSSSTASPSLFSSSDEHASTAPSSTSNTPPNQSSKESGSDSPAAFPRYPAHPSTSSHHNHYHPYQRAAPFPISVRVKAQPGDFETVRHQVEAALDSLRDTADTQQAVASMSRDQQEKQKHKQMQQHVQPHPGASRQRFRPSDDVLAAEVDRLRLGDARRRDEEDILLPPDSVQQELMRAREELTAARNAQYELAMIDSVISRYYDANGVYRQSSYMNTSGSEPSTPIKSVGSTDSVRTATGRFDIAQPTPTFAPLSRFHNDSQFVPSSIA